jgi:hypothetical protein
MGFAGEETANSRRQVDPGDRKMPGKKNYTRKEIDADRAMVEVDLRAHGCLPTEAKTKEFEAIDFNRSVLHLDCMFVHRLTRIEGKDGNLLNETRVRCNSILLNQSKRRS